MSVLGIVALIFGVLGVWLTIKQSIWCWPAGLVAVLASITEFYNQRLFGDMSLQIIYFGAGVYGWIYWNRQTTESFAVTRTALKKIPALVIITVLQSVVFYYLLIYFKGDRPLLDGLLTACSLTATYMMTKKWVENWMAWVIIDAAYVLLYGLKDMWLFAVLNLLFTGVAFYGWLKWRKTAL
jgi:nicotinamide mononucleotide transporter